MALSDELLATTVAEFIPIFVDQVFKSNPLFLRLFNRGIKLRGGDVIKQPIITGTLNTSAFSGFDTFDINPKEVLGNLKLEWRRYQTTIAIDRDTELKNSGPNAVVDIVEGKMLVAQLSLTDRLGRDLFVGQTIGTDVDKAKQIDGLLTAIDDGTNFATYANINRVTKTFWKAGFKNLGGPISLLEMQKSYGDATVGPQHPTLIVTTQAIFNDIWNQLQPAQRATADQELFRAGFQNLAFNGAILVVDSHVPAGVMFFLNENFIDMFIHQDDQFEFSGWKRPTNQDVRVGHITVTNNLIVNNPRMHFQLSGITTS